MNNFIIGDFIKLNSLAKEDLQLSYKSYSLCIGKVIEICYHPIIKDYLITVMWLPSKDVQNYYSYYVQKSNLKIFI